MKRAIAAILALGIVVAGCSSGPTLTDAQLLWCDDNRGPVSSAQQALGLKDRTDVWVEVKDGSSLYDLLLLGAEDTLGHLEFFDDVWEVYLEHPDGRRACIAAYDSR